MCHGCNRLFKSRIGWFLQPYKRMYLNQLYKHYSIVCNTEGYQQQIQRHISQIRVTRFQTILSQRPKMCHAIARYVFFSGLNLSIRLLINSGSTSNAKPESNMY